MKKAFKEDLVNLVTKEYERRQKERRPTELRWRLNIEFLKGNHYIDINYSSMTLSEIPKLYEWQEREVFNHVAPITEVRIARLSRMRPIVKVNPGTNEIEDVRSARVGTAILRNVYNEQSIRKLLFACYPWLETCGTAFFKNIWNPNKGRVVAIDVDTGEEIREGELEVILVPATEIYPDSIYNPTVERCRSIIHAKIYDIDEIEEFWGKKVNKEEVSPLQIGGSAVSTGGFGYGRTGYRNNTQRLDHHAVVKEYQELPCKKYPKGRLIIVAGNELLAYEESLPFAVGENGTPSYNLTKVDLISSVGEFFGQTVLERMLPVQRRYNALRNRKAEFLSRAAIGQYTVEEGSVDLDTFEQTAGAAGSIHVYARNSTPPKPMETFKLPSAFDKEEVRLLEEFSSLSGVSEISRMSAAPPGVKSGVALQIALEQDDTRLATTAANIEQFLIENGKQWLRMYKQFVEIPRTLKEVGEESYVEVLDWDASDITSDDVVVEAWSALAESPAQRRQMVFDLLNTALFQDPETGKIDKNTREKIFELLEFGNWESGNETDKKHISKAERENRKIVQGETVMPDKYDDHALHIQRHINFRLSVEYEELRQKVPQLDQIFDIHQEAHLLLEAGNAAPQMAPEQGTPQQMQLQDNGAIPTL